MASALRLPSQIVAGGTSLDALTPCPRGRLRRARGRSAWGRARALCTCGKLGCEAFERVVPPSRRAPSLEEGEWCPELESNQHGFYPTRSLVWRVYQFRHPGSFLRRVVRSPRGARTSRGGRTGAAQPRRGPGGYGGLPRRARAHGAFPGALGRAGATRAEAGPRGSSRPLRGGPRAAIGAGPGRRGASRLGPIVAGLEHPPMNPR